MEEIRRTDECKIEVEMSYQYREQVPEVVERLIGTCGRTECFDHIGPEPISSRYSVITLLEKARKIIFPGYFDDTRLDSVNLPYYLGQEITAFFELLSEQIIHAFRHECLRYNQPCSQCSERGQKAALELVRSMPVIREKLSMDVHAAYEGDPAAKSFDEIIFSYPGIYAVTVHRIAHQLENQNVPLIPRIMSEYAHGLTGIDIHPGASIGESFFIDHGSGVVVGETTRIGNRVRLYQGVTLGALSVPPGSADSLRNRKRHPTIEDEVVIYSGATILGGDTVIGARSVIGGNVWLTESVPPDTKVFLKTPELVFKGAIPVKKKER